jgi:hypothetical protein
VCFSVTQLKRYDRQWFGGVLALGGAMVFGLAFLPMRREMHACKSVWEASPKQMVRGILARAQTPGLLSLVDTRQCFGVMLR